MIEKYITFNASQYIKDYYRYKEIITQLEDEYNALDGVSAITINQDKVQTSPKGDSLEKIAIQRIGLSKKIEDYRQHIKTCEIALELLDPEERDAIESFYKHADADIAASRTTIYRLRKQALEKLGVWICNTSKVI